MTNFYTVPNNANAHTVGYTAGAGSLVLGSGEGAAFGSTFPIVVSTFLADGTPLGIYKSTGISGNTLTGLTLISGSDTSLPPGSLVQCTVNGLLFSQIALAVNSLESMGLAHNPTASGQYSHVEGDTCSATGVAAHASGIQALANLDAEHTIASGQFAALGDAQSSRLVLTGVTADANPLNLGISNSPTKRLTVRNNCAYSFLVNLIGWKTGGSKIAQFSRRGLIQNLAGTTSLIGSVATVGTDQNTPAWSVAITADNSHSALQISVTGEATVRWVAQVELVEVGL